jgi:hypothetical protein
MRTRHLVSAALLLLQLGGSALADGPIIITQAKVLAGNVTPGDGPGFPVSITVPGSYRLGSNLDVPAGRNGIVVTNFNVSIDLDGFALDGGNLTPFAKALNGIVATGVETGILSVRNGTILAFSRNGISAATVSFDVFDSLQVIGNGGDGIVAENNVRITNSTISANSGWGVVCGFFCSVQSSVIASNVKGGIKVKIGNVVGNMIANNTGFGINGGEVGAGNNTFWINGGADRVETRGAYPLDPNHCHWDCNYATPPAPAPQ